MIENTLLEGNYQLRDEIGKPVPPEHFLGLFRDTAFYQDVQRFVRRVDNDTGIPFLSLEEYEKAKLVLPKGALSYYETNIISFNNGKMYLRGKDYYLNLQEKEKEKEDRRNQADFGFNTVYNNILFDLDISLIINDSFRRSRTLEERMIVGSLLDIYKNHLMVVFTGLYEAMKLDETIDIKYYNLIRKGIESIINSYYQFIIEGKAPDSFINQEEMTSVLHVIKEVVKRTGKVYDRRRYLTREFDHPGRMILYASHLLSKIKERGKTYDLLVNLLNGSAEIGLAVQSIDNILGTNKIRSTTIFEVDFARYSKKDREDKNISTYSEFESIAIPPQLKTIFKQRVEGRDILVVDDNLNTGQTLFNVKNALEQIAHGVDISVVEIVPLLRAIELLKEDQPEANPHFEIKLIESNLTYSPIGWWRDQREMNKDKIIPKIIGLSCK